jgi:hypothetical protein
MFLIEHIDVLKGKWADWQERRFLKRHGCRSRAQYERQHDPDVNFRADQIRDFYCGYPTVIILTEHSHYAYRNLWDFGPGGFRDGIHDILDWCQQNCEHKHRADFHRMTQDNHTGEYRINGLGVGDYYCLAFHSAHDAAMFRLRWG